MNFSLTIDYIVSLNWKKVPTNGYFKLHIYLHTNKTLIRNYIKLVLLYGTILNKHSSLRNVDTSTVSLNGSYQRPRESCAEQKRWGRKAGIRVITVKLHR